MLVFLIKDGTDIDHCTVDYEGDSGETKCHSKQIKIADSVKKYEDMLNDLEMKEEDLMDTIIQKELTNTYNEQKPLTNDEVINAFKNNKFTFVES